MSVWLSVSCYSCNVSLNVFILCVYLQRVKLEFVKFSVESCCDSVSVYDGSSRAAPLLGTFYGNVLPSDVYSTNAAMSVFFETDGTGTWKGFSINYTVIRKYYTD